MNDYKHVFIEKLKSRRHVEQAQRERMTAIFSARRKTPATADFDLPAQNDEGMVAEDAYLSTGLRHDYIDQP